MAVSDGSAGQKQPVPEKAAVAETVRRRSGRAGALLGDPAPCP